MFDDTTGTIDAPKPAAPRTYREPHIGDLTFCYALNGPAGWHIAIVQKLPLPGAYTLTISKAGDRSDILYRDTFSTGRGFLWDDDARHLSLPALLGAAIQGTTGSTDGWSMRCRPLLVDELIEMDTDGELRRTGGESFSFLL